MANNPYTKDITKSSAYRQVTNQNQDKLGQVLEGAVQIKKAFNNKVESNIQALAESKVIEIQKKKLMLKGLNGVSNIQNDIRDNYNNNVAAWSRDYAQKELRSETISKYGLEESETNKITLNHPNAAYGKWLDKRAQKIENNYTDLVNQLDSVGLPYKDLEEGSTFIDEVYQSAFNGLNRNNKFNIINSVGSLFKGHGLGNKGAAELKSEFDANIANSSISKLESINTTFKALYATNSELGKDYETVIENADIRQNVTTKFSEIKKEQRYDKKTGKTTEFKFQEVTHSYVDKDGNPRTTSSLVDVTGEGAAIDVTTPQTFSSNAIYLRMLEQDGHEQYLSLLTQLEPYQAFMAVRREHGKSFTELESQALRKELTPDIMTSWQGIQDSYTVTNTLTGEQSYRVDIQDYKDGKGARPTDFYNNIREYSKDVIGVALDIEPMNTDYRFPDKKTYQAVSGLSDSKAWKDFTSNTESINEIKEDLDMSTEFEQELLADFEAGVYANVDKEGNYFPMENEDLLLQTVADTGRALYLNPDVLDQLGLESSEFDGGAKIGYNVVTKTLVLKPFSDDKLFVESIEEDTVVPERTKGGILTQGIQALNDIPYLGAGTEFLFGDEFNWTDVVVFVPVGAGLAVGAKVLFGAGKKVTQAAIQKSTETIGRKMVQKGYDPFKANAKFGTLSSSGTSVELKSIGSDLLKTGFDPIKKGTAFIIGTDAKGRTYRIGGTAALATAEYVTSPSEE